MSVAHTGWWYKVILCKNNFLNHHCSLFPFQHFPKVGFRDDCGCMVTAWLVFDCCLMVYFCFRESVELRAKRTPYLLNRKWVSLYAHPHAVWSIHSHMSHIKANRKCPYLFVFLQFTFSSHLFLTSVSFSDSLIDRSPVGSTSHLESGPSGHWSISKIISFDK